MASSGGIWGPEALRLLRMAVTGTAKLIRTKVADASKPLKPLQKEVLQPIRCAPTTGRQHLRPSTTLIGLNKTDARWFSAASVKDINLVVRRYISSQGAAPRFDRSKLPQSRTALKIAQSSGRAPWANTLRPNLTGGALPRAVGGYSLGGNARYFSHTPMAPAQVVQNVSQVMRAFFLSGQRLRYDGAGPRGEAQYRAASVIEDEAMRKMASIPRFAPGAHVDFQLSPTITALGPLAAAVTSGQFDFDGKATVAPSLHTEGFLDVLSADFGRALKDLTAIYGDIQRLSALGDLPISLEGDRVLRVRFPGVDLDTLESLCQDIGIQRGLVGQDQELQMDLGAQMALRFPLAPDAPQTLSSPGRSERSQDGHETEGLSSFDGESFVHEAFALESGRDLLSPGWSSEMGEFESIPSLQSQGQQSLEEYEGLEGIYRFLEACDRAKGRLGR